MTTDSPNTQPHNAQPKPSGNSSTEIVYTRKLGMMPYVISKEDTLYLQFGGGADANHDLRTFDIPITEAHLEVIKNDFARHSLLWSALSPLTDKAGISGEIDQATAKELCTTILFGTETEVETLFKNIAFHDGNLIAHHADVQLLAKGELFAALKSLTYDADLDLAAEHFANRRRASRGIYLGILDAAILKYTGQYLHGGGIPQRNPDAVDPELLPQVLEIVAIAEQAKVGMEFPWDYDTDDTRYLQRDKKVWKDLKDKVEAAVRSAYPTLVSDSVETISFLICREEARRVHLFQKKS